MPAITPLPTNFHQGDNDAIGRAKWPEACKYFVPETMDPDYARYLLKSDTGYLEATQHQRGQVDYLGFSDAGGVNHQRLVLGSGCKDQLEGLDNLAHSPKVFFIRQKRIYNFESTRSQISVTLDAWLNLLEQLKIPSLAVELLHDNNGGCGSHISYCSASGPTPCAMPAQSGCAFHVWIKLGDWGNSEHFAYARHDFHTGRDLCLVLGTDGEACVQRLAAQFKGQFRVGLFPILLALTSSWARAIERQRWTLDFSTQMIESQTGHSCLRFDGVEPLAPEQLRLSGAITATSDFIQTTITGALNMANIFTFLSTQPRKYAHFSSGLLEQQLSPQLETHLLDALSQALSQTNAQVAQMHGLKGRVDAQWSVVNALITQRNSQINIEIAAATKADSKIMRGIAFVTMIFLPATFVATFFSMVFFQLSSDDRMRLVVSKWTWLYPACAIPLTVMLVLNHMLKA